jgi:tRNA-modifying protein YgfZ
MLRVTPLESFVPIRVQGADARAFMQGQLSYDVRKLTSERAVWGGHCTGQGRVQLVMTLLEREEGLVALCDSSSANDLLASLRARIFSSKVSFEPLPLAIAAVSAGDMLGLLNRLPQARGECAGAGQVTVLRWWGAEQRFLLITPQAQIHALPDEGGRQALAWRESDVMDGLPRIFPETERAFVPQMLNLDLLEGISYDKGCYTGQEVVARARRGGVPRRLFRFSAGCVAPRPGTVVGHKEAEVGLVVDAVASPTGCELLAVVDLATLSAELSLRGIESSDLALTTLPYDVPRERR